MRSQEQIKRVAELFHRVAEVTETSPNISREYESMASMLEWVLGEGAPVTMEKEIYAAILKHSDSTSQAAAATKAVLAMVPGKLSVYVMDKLAFIHQLMTKFDDSIALQEIGDLIKYIEEREI